MTDALYHHFYCLDIIGVFKFLDQLYLHTEHHKIAAAKVFCTSNCEIDYLYETFSLLNCIIPSVVSLKTDNGNDGI